MISFLERRDVVVLAKVRPQQTVTPSQFDFLSDLYELDASTRNPVTLSQAFVTFWKLFSSKRLFSGTQRRFCVPYPASKFVCVFGKRAEPGQPQRRYLRTSTH